MAGQIRARRVILAPPVRAELEAWQRTLSMEHRLVERGRIILLASHGMRNMRIAQVVGVDEETVRKWRNRFADDPCVATLFDAQRTGRPAEIPTWVHCELIKIACSSREVTAATPRRTRSGQKRKPHPRQFQEVWTHAKLADTLFRRTGFRVSESEIGRILRENELRPHRMRVWVHSPDPQFRAKVRRICGLYLSIPTGAHVVCVDEKPCIQALERRFADQPAQPGRSGRREFEYIRHDYTTLLAAFDVATGMVVGHCYPNRKMPNMRNFMARVAQRYPDGDVYIVWDCLNTHDRHHWREFNRQHGKRFHFVYTPKHASWVNQVEIWFSILQRRVIRDGSFLSVPDLIGNIQGFIKYWNRHEAHPFRWTFRGRFHKDQIPRDAAVAA